MTTTKCTLLETYSQDRHTRYGLWSVTLGDDEVEVAAVIGVPQSLQGTADAAHNGAALADAWYNDASDHDGLTAEQRDEALGVMTSEARRIYGELLEQDLDDLNGRR